MKFEHESHGLHEWDFKHIMATNDPRARLCRLASPRIIINIFSFKNLRIRESIIWKITWGIYGNYMLKKNEHESNESYEWKLNI